MPSPSSPIEDNTVPTTNPTPPSILVAVPGVQDGLTSITALPSATRFTTIPPPKDTSTGMLMAVSLHLPPNATSPLVAAGYESGYVALWRHNPSSNKWETAYLHKSHSQPVLSLDMAPSIGCFFSCSADAIVARHPLLNNGEVETKVVQTKHAGQQSLSMRGDGKIFATAGWDGRVRVYAAKGLKELAVLKWHKEGCYATAFAEILDVHARTSDGDSVVARRELTVAQQRALKSQSTHWLAAGSKDGKVSLWDIY
jgi:WD40 repeat protein